MTDYDTGSQIDALVNLSRTPDPSIIPTRTTPDLRIDTATGVVTQMGDAPGISTRIGDSPSNDLTSDIESIDSRIAAIESDLAAVKYDGKTGAQTQVLSGTERENREALLSVLKGNRLYQTQRNAQRAAQRAADKAVADAAEAERAKRYSFIRNTDGSINAERAKAYDAAKLQAEAEAAVRRA
jgi:hypothetical protein